MYSSNKLIQQIVYLLKANNIRKIVVSPGSRHFPLSHSMENDSFFEMYSVVDERSAAFFALGLIQESDEPVAICCSSGTSVVNYGSAVSEAFYQKLPLLLLTADRVPELLGQMEDQMIKQDDVFREFSKYHGQLPLIKSELDEWYANRIINEALIELNHHGRGPVQLNYPIFEHRTDTFEIEKLPEFRRIALYDAQTGNDVWRNLTAKISDKKIMIVCGQSVPFNKRLNEALDVFCQKFDCTIITDRISNCVHSHAITNAFVVLKALSVKEQTELAPDVVITLGGNVVFNSEIKDYVKRNASVAIQWQVGPESKVCDTFRNLKAVFEMNEAFFFEKIAESESAKSNDELFNAWKQISDTVVEPEVGYSQLNAIGQLIHHLPSESVLHLANSNAIRMGHLFRIDHSVKCFCNRGVNGIDGSMSTAVGFAAKSNRPVFLIIGDLSFFYDMNALWNRHLNSNMRILLVNNQGGAVMHLPFGNDMGKVLTKHTSAGHVTSAKGWVESVGVKYMSANNEKELTEGINMLVDLSVKGPLLLEVFTLKDDDAAVYKKFMSEINRITLADKAIQKAGRLFKNILKK